MQVVIAIATTTLGLLGVIRRGKGRERRNQYTCFPFSFNPTSDFVCLSKSAMRDVCKYVLAGVAVFSAYQLTSDIVTQTGNAIESTVEWIITKGLEKEYEIMGTMGRYNS